MTKHSPSSSNSKIKYIYITPNKESLCWKSLDKDDEKQIKLKDIL